MRNEAFKALTEVSQARQDADAATVLEIKGEEQRLRAQLAALDEKQLNLRNLPMSDGLAQKRLGGDMLWQVWVGRRRRDLQMQLARNLARQGAARQALKKSFGKRCALETIQSDAQDKRAKLNALGAFERINGLSILRQHR